MTVNNQFWKEQQEHLQVKLSDFEHCVETPFVPGELEGWLNQTHQALQQLIPQIELLTQHIHKDEFTEIAEEDPGLLGRVESMRDEDRTVQEEMQQLVKNLEQLRAQETRGATETDLKQDLDAFVSTALTFLNRVRSQEVAIRTWLVEAFNRDRGEVD